MTDAIAKGFDDLRRRLAGVTAGLPDPANTLVGMHSYSVTSCIF